MSISKGLGKEKRVELPQGAIQYRETGDGEPIVFVHGAAVNGDLWRKVVPALADRFRCITPDLPLGGHRLAMNSDADLGPQGVATLISDFVTALGLKEVTLVANDSGGAVSQIVITRHPERISRLVLTNCDAFEEFPPRYIRPLPWLVRIPGFVFATMQALRFGPLRRLVLSSGAKSRIGREISDSYLEHARSSAAIRRDLTKFLTGMSPKHTFAAARRFRDVTQPVLIAWGVNDLFFSREFPERLAAALPNSRLERIEDSRTFVPEDQPERLADLIREFMTDTGESAAAAATPAGGQKLEDRSASS